MKPTLQIYGTGNGYNAGNGATHFNSALLDRISPDFAFKWRSEQSFSPVFSLTGEMYAADGLLFFPDCELFSVIAAIAEKEVDNPFMQHKHDTTRTLPNNRKPIVLLGSDEDWKPVRDIIDGLSKHGTIRGDLFGKTVHFSHDVKDAIEYIKAHIPAVNGNKRARMVDHKTYIDKRDALDDLIRDDEHTPKPKSAPTIAFFGSATTKNSAYIETATLAGQMCAENGWNVIHGGGIAGVMDALTQGAAKAGVYVHGITAANTYAMFLSGEKDPNKVIPDGQARFTSAKDMIHRIELYAKNSEALVALPGGVGTLEEILLTLKLLEENHPSALYEDKNGAMVKKPFILLNQGGIWDSLIAYFGKSASPELKQAFDQSVTVVQTVPEMNTKLKQFFSEHPPKTR
jgi:uncharacterized protein (TIGR00730 family)